MTQDGFVAIMPYINVDLVQWIVNRYFFLTATPLRLFGRKMRIFPGRLH